VDLVQTLIDATQEIFSSMVMLGTTPGSPFERGEVPLVDSVSGMISFVGTYQGVLAIHLPSHSAMEVAGSFLDMEIDEIGADVCDATAEIANMLAGNLKSVLDPGGSEIQLSMPTTSFGEEYSVERLSGATNITIPFYLDDGEFIVELQIKS